MRKQFVLSFVFVLMLFLVRDAFAYNNSGYPYSDSSCRLDGPSDPYGFRKANCTSYVAYMLNLYGVGFNNAYLQPSGDTWSNAGLWDDAAGDVVENIIVDDYPLPGDVAYWNTLGGTGHVAWVEKVYYDISSNPIAIDITEYNVNYCAFGQRINLSLSGQDHPDGFIHILAYNEGVASLHYLDCYDSGNLCSNQTHEEWGWIANKAWNDYRCTSCTGNYDQAFVNSTAIGFGGGGNESGSTSLPDFIIKKIWLEDANGNTETNFSPGEAMKIKIEVKNVGTDTPSGVDVDYFRSNGYNKDSNPTNVGTDFINKDDLDGGETHTETKNTTAPTTLGTYNMTAHADSGHDVDEEHESNNWSDEAVFVVANPPPNLSWLPNLLDFYLN